ncbi:dehydrogenase/reductase SDR family member 1 isoform X2 [Hypanus sabinus]|nr:dehydrogenase/reductase SDR family member 1 isoform X2 [Hypanus sabinus]XP_059807462.1 dehydrogenase/reductase SDR family member 1 isoform X2 [Hypanus sabinus]XP_059807463.1 dehydrogenase/reductase SDR family member 1 isoform X2 [Hypanus sabinus]XP_059807464.1 dehydrogenase/reductase SDR family member 1 isoform X2 [Hypanus sabinus]XP_059807465.1 dehydrogenase/reductase SDR family member 1 isoform X2 [Hypanus sabinus]XP_059807466.1 dehydrogenase/reductase SDR family member 1 isoform X2 [Hypa
MARKLLGHICIVTGASRGIGKGIALQLGEAGATVYITGRNMETLRQAAEEVAARGGKCVPVVCDSGKEEEVRSLFGKVQQEQDGRLDILVNNAYSVVQAIFRNRNQPFWETPPLIWDDINNVGLRGHYLCSVYGARMMVKAGRGLIVVISSMGGLRYTFNVAYGVGKAACDRLAQDCAVELRRHGVSCLSLWPGAVRTETAIKLLDAPAETPSDVQMAKLISRGETPEMSGLCIVALATDRNLLKKSGRVHLTSDLASEYGLVDVDGRPMVQYRSLGFLLQQVPGLTWLGALLPDFIKAPKWMMALIASRF